MKINDKRKEQRILSTHLIFYISLDEHDQAMMQGMGRTLNVSEGGILLETHVLLNPHYRVILTIALEDELMEFMGRIAHSTKQADGSFATGVQFIDMDDRERRYLRQYVILFAGLNNNL
ncbi:MAG: PilZ domain-containing protein [Thermodesulfobacteriota bacterium]